MDEFIRIGRAKISNDEVCQMLCNSEEIPYDSTDEDSGEENVIPEGRSTNIAQVALICEEVAPEEEAEISFDINASVHDSFIDLMNDDNLATTSMQSPVPTPCFSSTPITSNTSTSSFRKSSDLFPSEFQHVRIDPNSLEFQKIIWKNDYMQFSNQQVGFRGDSSLPDDVKSLVTPYQVWSYLFPQSLEELIVEETLRYAGVDERFSFNVPDLRKFIGINFYMTYFNLSNSRDFWSKNEDRSVHAIKKQMPSKQFEKIRQYLHFNDKYKKPSHDDPERDRLYLIRPVIDRLNMTFGSVPKKERLSVDEQMCSTKMGSYMKQYLPNKPKKWGFKFYVLCDTSGYAHKFEIYTGMKETILPEEPDLQASANIVVRLVREVPRFKNYILYFDNYYTSIPLILYLRSQGILSVGTIRRNRIKNCKFPDEKTMMKFERGTSKEFVASVYGMDVTSISWKDTRVVNLVSTYIGTKPVLDINADVAEPLTVKRFDKKERTVKQVPCPQIVKDYNAHMGGVDLMDSSMSRHKITMKSRKWTTRMFYHLLDMTCVNAWILYKRINNDSTDVKNLRLIDFKLEVADSLFGYKSTSKEVTPRGRPNLETEIQNKRRKPNSQTPPPKDVRLDGTQHWTVVNKKGRCKLPGCTGQTKMFCSKCEVNLCLTVDRNCFYKYHNQ